MTAEPSWRALRRRKIISAAAELFARGSYDGVQMDDIARRADVGKPTLYRYFPSKQELFLSVCEEAFQDLEDRLDAAVASDTCPHRQLTEMFTALVDVLGGQLAALDVLDAEEAQLTWRWRQIYRRARTMIVSRLAAVLEAGVARGDFAPLDSELLPEFLIGIFRGGLAKVVDRPREDLVDAMMAFVRWGLAPRDERRTAARKPFAPRIAARVRR